MTRPDWCPQDVWDKAGRVLDGYLYSQMSPDEAIARALIEAEARGAERKEAEIADLLQDPAAVRVNYLRGGIACQHLIDEAAERMKERAAAECDAVAHDAGDKAARGFMTTEEQARRGAGRSLATAIRNLK